MCCGWVDGCLMYRKRRCLSVMAAGTRIFGMNLAVFGRINAVLWGAIQSRVIRCQSLTRVRVGPLLDYVSGSDARAFGMDWPLDCNSQMPAVTFIDAIPNHISEEDHRSLTVATPVSFSDIPPVLRHKVNDVAVAFDPPLDGFSSEDSARGTLYIIERYMSSQYSQPDSHS